MRKKPVFTHQQYLDMLDDQKSRRAVNACLITALDQWKDGYLTDYAISDVLKKAAVKIISIY